MADIPAYQHATNGNWRTGMHLKVTEAAERLRLSKSTLDKLRVYGGGPTYFKLGRTVVYAAADLDAWMTSRRRESTAVAANDNTGKPARAAA